MFDNILKIDVNKAKQQKKKEILVIEPAVVDHCNLNCAYCDHLSPLAKEGYYDVNQFEKDFSVLSKVLSSDYILNKYDIIIQLVGGEPFLHPKLLDFADIVFKYINPEILKSFVIITNGTLFHKRMDLAEKHRQLYKKYGKPGIVISKYPIVSENYIRKTFAEYVGNPDIRASIEDRNTFNKVNLDFNSKELTAYCSDNCMCLRNGKLFKCPISGNIHFLMEKLNSNLEVIKPEDYLDLTKPLTPKIFDNFHQRPRNFCYYCKRRNYNTPWKKSEQDPQEWLSKEINNV